LLNFIRNSDAKGEILHYAALDNRNNKNANLLVGYSEIRQRLIAKVVLIDRQLDRIMADNKRYLL